MALSSLIRRAGTAALKRVPHPAAKRQGIEIPATPEETVPLLKRLLHDNITPYWYPMSLDVERGGYILARDRHDNLTAERHDRVLIMQARMFWFFSRLCTAGLGTRKHFEAAEHGFAYLRDVMWDPDHGGYFWKVDSQTRQPSMPRKHVCAQAYVLFGLCEFAKIAKDAEPERMARDLYQVLETHTYDPDHPGYREFFEPDWTLCQEDEVGYVSDVPPGTKRHACHIHLFEAFLDYYDLTKDPQVLQRIQELVEVLTVHVVRPEGPACTDNHRPDWTPVINDHKRAIAYGHDLETAWMIPIGLTRAGLPETAATRAVAGIFDYALDNAFDARDGGFYTSGPLPGPAYRRDKQWWIQAEALVCALHYYLETGDTRYGNCYLKTLDWVVNVQADWSGGEWHNLVAPNGRIMNNKADKWKAAYHTGRSMITCLELLGAA